VPRRLAATSPLVAPQPLLAQLARVSQYDLRLPVVIADLPCHTDALAAERGFGSAELGPMISVYDRGENGMRVYFPRSNSVGCDRACASNWADATTPQTVAVSPM